MNHLINDLYKINKDNMKSFNEHSCPVRSCRCTVTGSVIPATNARPALCAYCNHCPH